MHSLAPNYLNNLRFRPEDLSTLKAIGKYQGKQDLFVKQTQEILESLLTVAVIESSESSNRLEGVTAPRERVEALVLKSATPKNRSEQEIAGYRDALTLIHESAEHMEFSVNIIKQLHSTLYRYLPDEGGNWKMVDNDIVERNPDGSIKRVRFSPTSAVRTPHAMDELVARYKAAIEDAREPMIVIPLAVFDFLCIHPFRDGNGRVARLLTLLLLYHFGYQVGAYISMERIFEEARETYYETLYASSQGWHEGQHDVAPWMTYFWGVVLRAYREFEERVGEIRTAKGAKTEQVKMAVARKIGPFSISDIESDCPGTSRDMVRVVLNKLREDNLVTLVGKGRGAKWIRKEP